MSTIRIILDRQNPVYKCGETISGKIRLCLNAPLIVSEVKISFLGQALANWVEYRYRTDGTGNAHKHSIPYSGSEGMALPTITVWPVGGQLRGSTVSLLGGQHDFNFSFLIPAKVLNFPLLGSFVTPLPNGQASMTYWLEARIVVRQTVQSTDRPAKSQPDLLANERIVILEHHDLNTDPQASLPVAISDEHPIDCCLWCFCCSGGRIGVNVKLPKSGYAIGEFIGITAEIINQSHKTVEQVQIRLVQTSIFAATSMSTGIFSNTSTMSSKAMPMVLAKIRKNRPLHSGQTQHWENEGFVIPAEGTRPSMGCRIIRITHHLAINIVPEGCFSEFSVMVPVIIGTVPIIDTVSSCSQSVSRVICDL